MRATSRKGVAMLSALGVLVILGLISSVFSAHMRLQSAYSFKDAQDFKAHYLAVAGVQDAISRLKSDSPQTDSFGDSWWTGESPEITPLGEGGYTLTIADEAARINVMKASPQMLGAILGGDKEALAAVVKHRSSGNGFNIKDLSGAVLSADALSRITTLGTTLGDGKVNINTANADVIAAFSGMDAEAAGLVVEFRKGADGMEGTDDDRVFVRAKHLAKVPGLTRVMTAPAIELIRTNSSIFRVESVGSVFKGTRLISNKKITVVLRRDNDRNVRIISWESS